MTPDEFSDVLRQTLEDHRMSRGERRALRDIVAELSPDNNRRAAFRAEAFDLAREAIASGRAGKDAAVVDWLEEAVKVLAAPGRSASGRAEAYFSPGAACLNRIVDLLSSTRRSADICVFTITDDRISDAIINTHARGIEVRVISDNYKATDRGSDIERLSDAGVRIRVDRSEHHMHHKFAIFDRSLLLTGSYNWTRSAERYNWENLVVLDHTGLIDRFSDTFESMWKTL